MTEEFCLSDRIKKIKVKEGHYFICVNTLDVKEVVRLLNELIDDLEFEIQNNERELKKYKREGIKGFREEINKIFGDKIVNSHQANDSNRTISSTIQSDKRSFDDSSSEDKIRTARRCMDFTGKSCDNKGCVNKSCPLNKVYDKITGEEDGT